MTGAIPPYTQKYGYRKVREDYAQGWNSSRYQSVKDPDYRIKAEVGSKRWHVFHGVHEWTRIFPSLTAAMIAVNANMERP